jgi:hypothetical protein
MGNIMDPYRVWNIVLLDLFCNTQLGALNTFTPLAPQLMSLLAIYFLGKPLSIIKAFIITFGTN